MGNKCPSVRTVPAFPIRFLQDFPPYVKGDIAKAIGWSIDPPGFFVLPGPRSGGLPPEYVIVRGDFAERLVSESEMSDAVSAVRRSLTPINARLTAIWDLPSHEDRAKQHQNEAERQRQAMEEARCRRQACMEGGDDTGAKAEVQRINAHKAAMNAHLAAAQLEEINAATAGQQRASNQGGPAL